jgi:transmembrane sensor
MAEKTDWKYLMDKFASNTCTREEFDRVMELMSNSDGGEGLTEEMRRLWDGIETNDAFTVEGRERFLSLLRESSYQEEDVPIRRNVRRMVARKWIAAASVAIMIGAGYLGWNWTARTANSTDTGYKAKGQIDTAVGGRNRATLILADGTSINLDTAGNGTIAIQGSVKIIKGEEGEILYYPDRQRIVPGGYNTLITPRGGKYCIVLSDGTKVWLNAASSMKFPAEFANGVRNVSLKGEAYFEVTKNSLIPFLVKVGDLNVKVLGTHFNINAYTEEGHVQTTLVQGAVKVFTSIDAGHGVMLKPGQQANMINSDGRVTLDAWPNMEKVMAWRNGNFEFVNTPVPVILREIGRWYDLDIVYEKNAPSGKRLTGTFSRNMRLDQLTAMLRYAGINMTINDKKLLILPN